MQNARLYRLFSVFHPFLDNLTFDKLLSKFDASLIKFDVAYPYGDKHEEFAKVRIKQYHRPIHM